jgi:hypothetical protein
MATVRTFEFVSNDFEVLPENNIHKNIIIPILIMMCKYLREQVKINSDSIEYVQMNPESSPWANLHLLR